MLTRIPAPTTLKTAGFLQMPNSFRATFLCWARISGHLFLKWICPMAKHTQVKAQNHNGNSLHLTQHETDSPVLPVAQLEQLHAFRPDLVDWVKDQTEKEAQARRARTVRIDKFILVERIAGLVAGTLISCVGIGAAVLLAFHEQAAVACVIGGGTLVGLVAVLVQGKKSAKPDE